MKLHGCKHPRLATSEEGGQDCACHWPGWLRCAALCWVLAMTAFAQPASSGTPTVRLGISARDMGNTNRVDVTAALKAWLLAVTRESHIPVNPHFEVYDSVGEMANALRREQIDVVIVPTDEFILLEQAVPLSRAFASQVRGKIAEEYVLLVHKDRPLKEVKDLRGETLLLLDHPRNGLAPLWLDTELLRNKLPVSARFFGRITRVSKLNLAILPVFFKQAGAALVSRSNFEMAGELNPQLSKMLIALAVSPVLIPSMNAYRANAPSMVVRNYQNEALRLAETPSGRLILNLFQTDGVVELKGPELDGTRAFLAEYTRLKTEAARKEAAP